MEDRLALSVPLATVAMLKAMIGGAVLAMPYAFGRVRLGLAVPGTLLAAWLVLLGTDRLVECRVLLRDALPKGAEDSESDDGSEDGADCGLGPLGVISRRVLGRPGLVASAAMALLGQLGTGIAYTDVLVETLGGMAGGVTWWLRVLLCAALCMISLVRGMGSLAWLSAAGLLIYAYMFVTLVRFAVSGTIEGSTLSINEAALAVRWGRVGEFLGTTIAAFEGVVVAQYLYDDMQVKGMCAFRTALYRSYVIATLVYMLVGCLGYVTFGDAVADIFYESFSQGLDIRTCEFVLCVVLMISYPLQMYPVFSFLEDLVVCSAGQSDSESGTEEQDPAAAASNSFETVAVLLRCAVVILTSVVACAIPSLSTMTTLLGGLCFSYLGFVLPALVHIKLLFSSLTLSEWASDACLLAFGIAAMVLTILPWVT